MKTKNLLKLILSAMPIVGFTACNDGMEEIENIVEKPAVEKGRSIRSVEDAIDIASQAAELFGRSDVLSRGTSNL